MLYFDNAATTFRKPRIVYKKALRYYKYYNANAGRGQHYLSLKATEMINNTATELLTFLKFGNNCKVVFTPSATISLNMILQGLDFSNIKNVYISPFEHNAVLRVLYFLQRKHKFTINILKVSKDSLKFDFNDIKQQFMKNEPNLLVISHISNVFGIIAPIKELFSLSKQYECINVVDMSQSASLLDIDMTSVDFDFAVFAGHKTLYAFQGVAGIIHKNKIKLNPIIFGGTGINSKDKDMPKELTLPGTANILSIASLHYSLQYLKRLGLSKIERKERQKTKLLKDILSKFDNLQIICNNDDCISIISCIVKGVAVDDMAAILNKYKICVRAGIHCSPLAHEFSRTPNGTLRFSISLFNKKSDFSRLKSKLNIIFKHI